MLMAHIAYLREIISSSELWIPLYPCTSDAELLLLPLLPPAHARMWPVIFVVVIATVPSLPVSSLVLCNNIDPFIQLLAGIGYASIIHSSVASDASYTPYKLFGVDTLGATTVYMGNMTETEKDNTDKPIKYCV